ncbi:unnamed protein product (macronuclear) [Paramecium tetraurelia]|uniref:Transmembrane protein n=1 Tax=Paramecium tetraurelia TaxID=5888 RepID=A0D2F0_PARTE|nr:uncharacterized protein GSPATT00012724001 [Paramecium tetraurelia]CAK77217.1 unnamed protein product [Paramecium tetraurelia]|eukprot:XP_001444614.1 hypothetical protein (macronuclear) [Paramecium tetraurelia strain d4-2]
MINLKEEQRIEKIKLVNIFGLHFKYTLILLIINTLIRTQGNDSFYITITQYLTLMNFAFNFIAATFLVCLEKEFPKLEYFLIYTVNIFGFIILLVYSLNYYLSMQETDPALHLYVKAFMLILLQKEIEILIIKIFPLEFMNRFVNSFTSCIIAALILSHEDNYECQHNYSMISLSLLLTNLLTTIINVIFTLILFNQNKQQKEIRNFANMLLTVLFIIHIAQYIYTLSKTYNKMDQECNSFRFIFAIQNYVAPINLICFCFVIVLEVQYFKQNLEHQNQLEKNDEQKKMYSANIQISQNQKLQNKQSMKSLSSIANPMEASSKYFQQTPNFKSEKVEPKLQKMGTSQFGESQHNPQMINSWGNVQNGKLFVFSIKEQNDNIGNQRKGNKSVDENFIRQEESQMPEILSQVNNPMESGSVITIH